MSDGLTTTVDQEKSVAAPQYFWLMFSQEEKSGCRVFDP